MDSELYKAGKTLDFLRDLQNKILMGQLSDEDRMNAHLKLAVAISLIKDIAKDVSVLARSKMTHDEVVGLLNEERFGDCDDWRMDAECVGLVRNSRGDGMSIGTAHTMARQIENERWTPNE